MTDEEYLKDYHDFLKEHGRPPASAEDDKNLAKTFPFLRKAVKKVVNN